VGGFAEKKTYRCVWGENHGYGRIQGELLSWGEKERERRPCYREERDKMVKGGKGEKGTIKEVARKGSNRVTSSETKQEKRPTASFGGELWGVNKHQEKRKNGGLHVRRKNSGERFLWVREKGRRGHGKKVGGSTGNWGGGKI